MWLDGVATLVPCALPNELRTPAAAAAAAAAANPRGTAAAANLRGTAAAANPRGTTAAAAAAPCALQLGCTAQQLLQIPAVLLPWCCYEYWATMGLYSKQCPRAAALPTSLAFRLCLISHHMKSTHGHFFFADWVRMGDLVCMRGSARTAWRTCVCAWHGQHLR